MDTESYAAGKVAHLNVRNDFEEYAYGQRYIFLEKSIDSKTWRLGYLDSCKEFPRSSLRNIDLIVKLEGEDSYLWETVA